jgi:hypothetical protein
LAGRRFIAAIGVAKRPVISFVARLRDRHARRDQTFFLSTDHGINFCADDSLAKCQTRTPVPIKRMFSVVGVGQRCNQSCAAFEAGKLPRTM